VLVPAAAVGDTGVPKKTGEVIVGLLDTKAVVATCVVLVPVVAVGARGVPVKVGPFVSALEEIAAATAFNSASSSVPLITLAELPVGRLSLTVKL